MCFLHVFSFITHSIVEPTGADSWKLENLAAEMFRNSWGLQVPLLVGLS